MTILCGAFVSLTERLTASQNRSSFQFHVVTTQLIFLDMGVLKYFFITLNACQGYHQIRIRECDQEKLAFFAPDGFKYCFTVILFGTTNAPTFYTAMMRNLKEEWDNLFLQCLCDMRTIGDLPISANKLSNIYLGDEKVICGTLVLIGDILLWSSRKDILLH